MVMETQREWRPGHDGIRACYLAISAKLKPDLMDFRFKRYPPSGVRRYQSRIWKDALPWHGATPSKPTRCLTSLDRRWKRRLLPIPQMPCDMLASDSYTPT